MERFSNALTAGWDRVMKLDVLDILCPSRAPPASVDASFVVRRVAKSAASCLAQA
jgi:hypothetical protein